MAAVDRISELPESILHVILSSLSYKQAIQTSVLSKQWRHVGPTRPKIELRQSSFKKPGRSKFLPGVRSSFLPGVRSSFLPGVRSRFLPDVRASFLSVVGKTLQRYYDRNLSVHEFIFDMSSESNSYHSAIDSESRSLLDSGIPIVLTDTGLKKVDFSVPQYDLSPSVIFRAESLTELCLGECNFMSTTTANDLDQPLFNGLKRLSLNKVCIEDETLEAIIRTCPLIEYISMSNCVVGMAHIPVALNLSVFPAESSLEELHLVGCNLISTCSSTDLLLIKRLKTLSLDKVGIREETLAKIMCSCPLIKHVLLSACVGLKTIRPNQLHNNYINYRPVRSYLSRMQTRSFETISLNWYGFQEIHLKSLCLNGVRLSAELFQSLSSNFPCLEDLEIQRCSGFRKIQLTLSSVKRLVITSDSNELAVMAIHAPSIRYFELSVHCLPRLLFRTGTAREWKSRVVVLFARSYNNNVLILPWLIRLRELLNALRESQISLDVCSDLFRNVKVEDKDDAGFLEPVPLEQLSVKGDYKSSSFPEFLNCLFLISRPRYLATTNSVTDDLKREKYKLADEFIVYKIIRNQGEMMSRGYLWKRDLEGISMQILDEFTNGWQDVRIEGASFLDFTTSDRKIRFPLKWREIAN